MAQSLENPIAYDFNTVFKVIKDKIKLHLMYTYYK